MIRINPDRIPHHTIQEVVDARNKQPDPELGELSPNQVYRLTHLPWEDSNFPIKFNKNIELSQLKDSSFFNNTTTLLTTLLELKEKDTATAKRNLNRKVVQAVFDSLVLDSETRADILRFNKVINEDDVMPLNVVRIVCERETEKVGLFFLMFTFYCTRLRLTHFFVDDRVKEYPTGYQRNV